MIHVRCDSALPHPGNQFKGFYPCVLPNGGKENIADSRLRDTSPLTLQYQQQPFQTEPEPDPRYLRASAFLYQAVIPSASADRSLGADGIRNDFKYRFGIIVEPAYDHRIDFIVQPRRLQITLRLCKMIPAFLTKIVQHMGHPFQDLAAALVLAVQDAQGIFFIPFPAVVAQFIQMSAQIAFQRFLIGRTAFRTADAVQLYRQIPYAQIPEQCHRQGNNLRVHRSLRRSESLHAKLMKFP